MILSFCCIWKKKKFKNVLVMWQGNSIITSSYIILDVLEITGTRSLRRTEANEQNPDCLPGLSQCQTCHPTLGSWTGIDLPWSFSASASVCGARKVASQPVRWKESLHRPSCSTQASERVRYNSGKTLGLLSLYQQANTYRSTSFP